MAQDKSSKGEMGFWTCSALVIGNMVGSGVFLLPASLTPYGGLSLIGWLVSSAGAILLALTFSRTDSTSSNSWLQPSLKRWSRLNSGTR